MEIGASGSDDGHKFLGCYLHSDYPPLNFNCLQLFNVSEAKGLLQTIM